MGRYLRFTLFASILTQASRKVRVPTLLAFMIAWCHSASNRAAQTEFHMLIIGQHHALTIFISEAQMPAWQRLKPGHKHNYNQPADIGTFSKPATKVAPAAPKTTNKLWFEGEQYQSKIPHSSLSYMSSSSDLFH